ncbi:MAG TPA: class C beta-lactamase-related serine hydrolase [Planctomycetaceae bacterium]|nr:class C beta-lactamase-related serine hydrolase [Planctomycetaceae bacterium]HIQ22232.1 class C beta-lactamase-related serine hydrolase [Planctomycetota bacterium]
MQRAVLCLLLLVALPGRPAAAGYPVRAWRQWRELSSHRFPGRHWQMYAAPEEAGWSSEGLEEARREAERIGAAAVLVVFDGAILAAWDEVTRRYPCHSIRKSFLSALYGIHVESGTIDLNRTLAELGIDDRPPLTAAEKRARVVDLLRSRSGIYHPAAYETAKMKARRPPRGSHGPGEFFYYNNWDFNALCTIFEQETGSGVFEAFQRRIAAPLGMEDFRLLDTYYQLEQRHSIHPAYPFRMSARDMARFGLLFLRQGQWEGQRIVSAEWVRTSTAAHSAPADSSGRYGYGYLWWRILSGPLKPLGVFSARGYGGHSIDVVPGADVVFVHRVDTFWDVRLFSSRPKRRVSDDDRLKLLELVLQAREAPPKEDPRLVPFRPVRGRPRPMHVERETLARYQGHYVLGRTTVEISLVGDRLLLSGPQMYRFGLIPCSQQEFRIEDVEVPLRFVLDDEGRPSGLVIEPAPGKRLIGRPR